MRHVHAVASVLLLVAGAALAVGRLARGGDGTAAPEDAPKEGPKEAPEEAPKDAPPATPEGASKAPAATAVAPTAEQVTAWTDRLRRLAGGYRSLSRVDTMSRFAPAACRAVGAGPRVPASASDDVATHGRKLYALWSLDLKAYGTLCGFPRWADEREKAAATPGVEDCSQVMVKEAFEPVEMKADEKDGSLADGLRPAWREGKRWRPGEPKGLFVMFRLDPKTAGTDDGWVYGTVDPKGTVTEVGRIASCMKCHAEAKHGRLFGLPAGD